MKRVNFIWTFILLIIIGCEGNKPSTDDLIVVDVTVSYPMQELILQDFMDVEYVELESTDDFLCQGIVLDVGKDIMLIKNQIDDGDIFVFDRKGKGLSKFNHRGQGPEEYSSLGRMITLDEDNGEIFVHDFGKGILVYDLYGKFLRRFSLRKDVSYASIQNYDREHLICGESTFLADEKSTESQACAIISKKDGSKVNDIQIHFEKRVNTMVIPEGLGMAIPLPANINKSIIPYHNSWIVTEFSSDTIFRLLPDFSMTPFMARTPSIHSMNPEIFLIPIVLTDRYYFIETLKKEVERIPGFFPRIKLIYDRQEKTIHRYTICNDDYITPKTLEFSSLSFYTSMNNEIAFVQKIEAYELVGSNKKGELKGKLKEVAAELVEDSNPVIMLVKHKR